ncbi:FAD-binding domain-containing protein [Xylariaceae sp. FL1651]|nr:FAD-binding domain-containing protein [Xylariaceae sp. FL1651]
MRPTTYWSVLSLLLVVGDTSPAKLETRSDNGSRACKAFPGTAAWPSENAWAKFNRTAGGKLIKPGPPPGAVCHPGEPTYDPDQCAIVTAAWTTYDFHQRDPVSNMWQQYNNDTCLVDPNTPCSAAGYPAYVVNATTAKDVKLSLDFARKHNVRVVVKSSGHDYQGRSQAPGALSIWVHHMQDRKTHDSFKPKGCNFTIETTAVTVGGGAQLGTLYEELDKINQTIVGGGSKTVSVGGYITGGGHSILAPHYGMAADQVLEVEVVTPEGDIVLANECQNEDLFWAMRGGGGSTFGIMTSVTLITYPTPKIVGGIIAIYSLDLDAPFIWDMAGYILSQFPYLDSKGVSGYSIISRNITTSDGNNGTMSLAGLGGEFIIIDTQDPNDMQAIWDPIIAHAKATWPTAAATVAVAPYPSFQSFFSIYYDQNPAGYDQYIGSRLIDADSLTSNSTKVSEAFMNARSTAYLVAGKGVRDAKPRGGSTAVTPTWRKAIVHAVNGKIFAPLNATARAEALADVNTLTEPLRQLAPDMGAYVNENNPGEPDWQHTFWGENYERLHQIKRTVDPDDVLWCHPCVGNERWEQQGYELCHVGGKIEK